MAICATRRRRPLRALMAVALTAGVALTAAACGGESDGASTTGADLAAPPELVRGGTLRAAILGTPQETLNPLLAADNLSQVRGRLVYEPLAVVDRDFNVVPVLYTEATPNDDATEWTYTLHPDAAFADGTPLRGTDVLATMGAMRGTEGVANLAMVDVERSRADADTVTFALSQPVAEFDRRIAQSFFIVLPDGRMSDRLEDQNGSGPYRVVTWRAGQRSVLERRDDYWGGDDRGMADRIELIAAPDPNARLRALTTDQVDVADDITFVDAARLADSDQVRVHRSPAPMTYDLMMNANMEPFDDARVRAALRLAIDRPALVAAVTAGTGQPGNDLWGDGQPAFAEGIPQREQDLDRARELLAEAGTPRVAFTAYTAEIVPGLVAGTRLLARQAEEAGFDIDVEELPPDQYYARIGEWRSWPAVAFSMGLSFTTMVDFLHTKNAPFNMGWLRPQWDRDLATTLGTLDPQERQEGYNALQQELWDEGTDLVWGLAPKHVAAAPEVAGIERLGEFDYPDLTNVTVVD